MCHKVYVRVHAEFDCDGQVMPKSIVWTDSCVYEIDRVLDVRRAASRKVGGHGILYTVRIRGQATHLYREEDRWFVEAKAEGGH